MRGLVGAGCIALLVSGGARAVEAGKVSDVSGLIESGFSASTGKYGTSSTTTIETVPLYGELTIGRLSLDANLPYLQVKGDPDVIPGLGRIRNTNPRKRANGAANGSGSGVGDITLGAAYALFENIPARWALDLTGSTKLANGDRNQGLGTGANDYTLGLATHTMQGRWSLSGNLGYTWIGTTGLIRQKRDAWSASFDASYRISDVVTAGASFDAGERSVRAARAGAIGAGTSTREVSEYVSFDVGEAWKVQVLAFEGLTSASPDIGGGMTVTRFID